MICGERCFRQWGLVLLLVFSVVSVGFGGGKITPQKSVLFDATSGFEPSLLVSQAEDSEDRGDGRSPSKVKAFFFSFLLPGAGEYYAGSKKLAGVFLGTEAFLWATYFSFRTYGNWKKSDYQLFAASHAGADVSGKDHQYFVDIGNYDDIRAYNEAKLRQRDVEALYPEDETHTWEWDSESSRQAFEKLRVSSDTAYNRSLFVLGGIVVNHIISGIDAVRLARKAEKADEHRIRVGVAGLPEGGMVVSFWKLF